MRFTSFFKANHLDANRRGPQRFRKLCLELLEDRLTPAHLQLLGGGVGFLAMGNASLADAKNTQQIITDLQTTQRLSNSASITVPGTPPDGDQTVGTVEGTVSVGTGNLTNEGVDIINVSVGGVGDLSTERLLGGYSAGTTDNTDSPEFGTPVVVKLVADPGDKVGQAVTLHMNSQVTGAGTSEPGDTAQFSYSVMAVSNGQTISGVSGSFNPLEGVEPGVPVAAVQKTFATKIGDTFFLYLSLTGTGAVSSSPDETSPPGSFEANLSTLFFTSPSSPPTGADAIGVARAAADGVSATEILDSAGTGSFASGDTVLSFGLATDTFISGDWTGSGTSKIGIVRPDGNGSLLWVLDTVGDGVYRPDVDLIYHFGLPGDQPIVGDWSGDGKAKIGVVRPNGQGGLAISMDTNGDGLFGAGDQVFMNFGLVGDQVVVGDWNGDGKAKIGVARADGVTSDIALDTNGDGVFDASDQVFQYGLAGDKFIAGDWNASGVAKIGSYRPDGLGSLLFSLDTNGDGQFDAQDQTFNFGLSSDAVLIGKWHS